MNFGQEIEALKRDEKLKTYKRFYFPKMLNLRWLGEVIKKQKLILN